ncbi:hypothetical protein AKJ16_DCAP08160, partial [Drosera capensis]
MTTNCSSSSLKEAFGNYAQYLNELLNESVQRVEIDDFHDVIVVDLPESLLEKLGKRSTSKVISIDDDDEEGHTDRTPDEDANPTSRDSYPASTSSPVILSKFKRTYSGKVGSTSRCGLGPDSENDSSDSDCSDCELMEGTSGKLREQWEQTFQRKNEKHKIWSGYKVHADLPASNDSLQHHHGEESREKVQAEDLGLSSSAHPRYEDDTFWPRTADGNDHALGQTVLNPPVGKTQGGASGESGDADPSRTLPLDSDTEFRPSFAPSECYLDKKTGCKEQRLSEEPSSSNPRSEDEGGKVVDEGQKVDEEQLHGSGCRDMDDLMEEDPAAESSSGNPVVDNENDRPPSWGVELSQDGLIIDRQKLKETDEYERAMEEELASRQQLQIQKKLAGAGCIIRDHKGSMVVAASYRLNHIVDISMAEAEALRRGLLLAKRLANTKSVGGSHRLLAGTSKRDRQNFCA